MMKKKYSVCIIASLLTVILTVIIFNTRKNYLYTNRDRIIILAYQTNITGSDGEGWANSLKTSFPEYPDFEVSCYTLERAGNEAITITSSDGWQDIVVRLAAKQCDILLLNNQSFYEYMLSNGLLSPLYGFDNAVTDGNGTPYGIDVTGIAPDGLLNLDTSSYVGSMMPLPLHSADEKDFVYASETYAPRVIAAVYKGSLHTSEAIALLKTLFGEV